MKMHDEHPEQREAAEDVEGLDSLGRVGVGLERSQARHAHFAAASSSSSFSRMR